MGQGVRFGVGFLVLIGAVGRGFTWARNLDGCHWCSGLISLVVGVVGRTVGLWTVLWWFRAVACE